MTHKVKAENEIEINTPTSSPHPQILLFCQEHLQKKVVWKKFFLGGGGGGGGTEGILGHSKIESVFPHDTESQKRS